MKTFVVLAVSIVLVSILFCPMVMAALPSMPADLQIVQPDPSLPKELSAFFGKWELTFDVTGSDYGHERHFIGQLLLIVEKIDEEKASLYIWREGDWPPGTPIGWTRYDAKVIKDRGKFKITYLGPVGNVEYSFKDDILYSASPSGTVALKRLP